MSARIAPPNYVIVVATLVLAIGVVMMFAGAWVVGATWDERTHVLMLQTYLERGWNVTPDALLADGQPDPNYPFGTYVYGPVAELLAHFTNVALGIEKLWTPTYTALSTSGRHVGTALLGLLGIGAAAATVRLITGSARYAVLSAAMLCSTALWVGHSMFNIKDLPVATGYTLGTAGVVAFAHSGFRSRPVLRWMGAVSLVTGAVLASGTRPAMGVPLAAAAVGTPVVLALLRTRLPGAQAVKELHDAALRLAWSVVSLLGAYLALVAIYPNAYANPANLAWQALVVSARFPFSEEVLTAGMWMEQPPPWTYLPLWFGAQLPLLVTAFLVVGVVGWIHGLGRTFRRRVSNLETFQQAMTFAVVLQLALMPLLGIALRSTMYNAQRQFLFIVPAVVVIATLGVKMGIAFLARHAKTTRPRVAFWGVISLGLVAPAVAQIFLFPYNYIYFNPTASAFGVNNNWPTDYWRASSNELMRLLPAAGSEYCSYESGRKSEMSPCSIEPMFLPYLDERGEVAAGEAAPNQGYWLIRENSGDTTTPDGCEILREVTRPLWGERVVISQIFSCRG